MHQLQAGKAVKLGSGDAAVDAYLVLPPGVTKPEAAVVIFTDIYGWELNNTRLWADRLAKEGGFLVVVPDFFHNDSLTDLSRQDFGACESGCKPHMPARMFTEHVGWHCTCHVVEILHQQLTSSIQQRRT